MNPWRPGLPLDDLAWFLESAPELRAKLEEWVNCYQPESPAESALIENTFLSLVQGRRVLEAQTELVNHQVRTARRRFDLEQEDQVEEARRLFATDPARAVLLLKRTAMGCRWMIGRYLRLKALFEKDGTLYGDDRSELIQLHGEEAYSDTLFKSEGAYLTWLYCLVSQPEPEEEAIAEMGSETRMPVSLRDRKTETWLPPRPCCQELLREQIETALAALRQREAHLRVHFEEPERASAERRAQVLAGAEAAQLERAIRLHALSFQRSYNALVQRRLDGVHQSRLGHLTSGHDPAPSTGPAADPRAPEAERKATAAAEARQRAAEAVAPTLASGIGAPIFRGDHFLKVIAEQGWIVLHQRMDQQAKPEDPSGAPRTPHNT
jgi:hypothetical protein